MNFGEKNKKSVSEYHVNDLTTEEAGLSGKTLFPDNEGIQNSTSNNVEVYINLGLSQNGRAEAYSHEANGHVLLYFRSGYNRLTRYSPWQALPKYQRNTIEEEWNIPNSTQLASESLKL